MMVGRVEVVLHSTTDRHGNKAWWWRCQCGEESEHSTELVEVRDTAAAHALSHRAAPG
jgi:hypothetical protein